jgi:hypothetical protein
VDILIVIAFFAPLVILLLVLVRHAGRIRRDAIDSDERTRLIDDLNPAIVRFVLERDRHTCQRCGATSQVGVDFTGETPGHQQEISAYSLEACCADCFLGQWQTLQDTADIRSAK